MKTLQYNMFRHSPTASKVKSSIIGIKFETSSGTQKHFQ